MRKFLVKCWRWIWMIEPVAEPSEYQVDDPHDPQYLTRIIHDDDFPFERWKP